MLRRMLCGAEHEIDRLRAQLRAANNYSKAAVLHQRVKEGQLTASIAKEQALRQELEQFASVRRLNKAQKILFGKAAPGVLDLPNEIEKLKFAKDTLGDLFLRSAEKSELLASMLQSVEGCLVALRDINAVPGSEAVITVIANSVDAIERGMAPTRKAVRDLKALPNGGLPRSTPPST